MATPQAAGSAAAQPSAVVPALVLTSTLPGVVVDARGINLPATGPAITPDILAGGLRTGACMSPAG
ncbi:MAG TPA: hypothetical protein VIO14_13690 [Dehalococcoidia bacterium]